MRYCQEKGIVCQYAGTNMHCRLTACVFPKESLYPTASGGGHLMEKLEPNSTCFFCDHYYHADPDTDRCKLDEHEVYFDTPRCNCFSVQEGT